MFKQLLYIIQKVCIGILLIIIANTFLGNCIAYSAFNILIASVFSVYGIVMIILIIFITK